MEINDILNGFSDCPDSDDCNCNDECCNFDENEFDCNFDDGIGDYDGCGCDWNYDDNFNCGNNCGCGNNTWLILILLLAWCGCQRNNYGYGGYNDMSKNCCCCCCCDEPKFKKVKQTVYVPECGLQGANAYPAYDGYGGYGGYGNCWWWIIIILIFCCCGNNGFGNCGNNCGC